VTDACRKLIGFAKDADWLARLYELLSLSVLAALFVASQTPNVLVAYDLERGTLRDTGINITSNACGNVSRLSLGDCQRARKYDDLTAKLAVWISLSGNSL
jgi:hypothetical protein